MKKIEEPIVKVMKLEAMDVIATSGQQTGASAESLSNGGTVTTLWN